MDDLDGNASGPAIALLLTSEEAALGAGFR